MKNLFSYIRSAIKRPLVILATLSAIVALPLSTVSAAAVQIEGSLGVANVTAGDTDYKLDAVNATFDQVVKFQVYYHNMEDPTTGSNAENLTVKINIPSVPGLVQTVSTTIKGDNTNTINDQVNVNLDRADAYIEYIPGSAVWKHNIGTNDAPNIVEEVVSDSIVTSGAGLNLEDEKPCFNFDATVTVLARVRVPAVSILKQSRVKGTTSWSSNNVAMPGDTMEYLITYENIGNTDQTDVIIGDNLPAGMTLVNGTTYLANATNPGGVLYTSDNIASGGINIGDYIPGGDAFIKFEVKIANAEQLECGANEFRNVGVVQPEGMNEYYNTAITTVTRACNPETPVYSCNLVTIEKLGGRKIKATVTYSGAPASRVVFKNIEYNFGDGSTPLVSTNSPVEYTYAKDGTYKVSAKVTFAVDGVNQTVSGDACSESVTFTSTPTTTPKPPKELPYTGAGSNIAIFLATTMVGMFIFRAIALKK